MVFRLEQTWRSCGEPRAWQCQLAGARANVPAPRCSASTQSRYTKRKNAVTASRFIFLSLLTLLVSATPTASGQDQPESQPPAAPQPPPAKADEKQPAPEPDSTAPPTLEHARDLLMSGAYDEALAAYDQLAAQPAQALPAKLGWAQCKLETGAYQAARTTLEELNAVESADWHCVLAQVLLRLGAYGDVLAHTRAAVKLKRGHAGARLLLGQTLELLGRRDEAIEVYSWFEQQVKGRASLPPDPAWITHTALGFLRYSVLTEQEVARRTHHVLNRMLQVAYDRLDRSYWPARIASADLLREKYNHDEEDGCVSDYRGALRINSKLPAAHVGLGRVALESWDFEEAQREAELALETNPNFAPALYLLAEDRLLERRYPEAREFCARALKINPNDLHALSLAAAAAACQDDETEVAALRRQVETLNPRCAPFYGALGLAYSGLRRYADSERALLKAIEYEPTDANARTELGLMYMQWGEEEKARTALDAAWRTDPFNDRTKFTLELLDGLESFARHETAHFIIKYDEEHDPGLGLFLGGFLEGIYSQITSDYDFEPPQKTIVEVFPTHREFGVRITGRPWIHTVGACTGRVIALDAPRASTELQGTYNIAQVLRHEFTHTVTLAATNNRIPHWYTEALAVSQEDGPRTFAWWEQLADAVRRDRLFPVERLNWGFIRPQRPGDRSLAYAQSEWIAEYIVERYGYENLSAMLTLFRDGISQAQVFAQLYNVSEAEFDRGFAVWARGQVERYNFDLTPPEDPSALRAAVDATPDAAELWGRLARAEHDADNPEKALEAAHRVLELDENNADGLEIAALVLAKEARQEQNDVRRKLYQDEILPLLERLAVVAPENWTASKMSALIYLARKDYDKAILQLERLQRWCPLDPTSWSGLGGIYFDRGDYDQALPQLLEVARIEAHDAEVPAQIAKIYRTRGQLPDALYWYRRTLNVNPVDAELQQALAETCMLAGQTQAALQAYLILTKVEPKKAKHFEQAAFAAHKLGEKEQSQTFARRAVDLDPQSPARSLLP